MDSDFSREQEEQWEELFTKTRILSHLYTAPKNCQILDKKTWKVAKPALGKFRSLKDIEDFAEQADRLPAKANSFRWLFLSQLI